MGAGRQRAQQDTYEGCLAMPEGCLKPTSMTEKKPAKDISTANPLQNNWTARICGGNIDNLVNVICGDRLEGDVLDFSSPQTLVDLDRFLRGRYAMPAATRKPSRGRPSLLIPYQSRD